jgi:hypothetical protein
LVVRSAEIDAVAVVQAGNRSVLVVAQLRVVVAFGAQGLLDQQL